MTLSAVVLTKNNEKTIAAQIRNLSFADQVVIIDDNSNDKTREIAKESGAKVYKRSLNNNFANQRNFGLQKASGEWVLFIDSDEKISSSLQKEILQLIKLGEYSGFYVKRVDYWQGKYLKHGEFGKTRLLRLGRKNAGKWKRIVHEYWDINNANELDHELTHYPHPTVKEFISEINHYSTLHAEANNVKKNYVFTKIVLYPVVKFCHNYFLNGGYKDGVHGFVAAVIMSFHSFLAWNKTWTKQY